jgi:hypothetical protein
MVLTKQTQNSNLRLFTEVKDCATTKVIAKSKNQGAAPTATLIIWNEISSLLTHIVKSRSTIVVLMMWTQEWSISWIAISAAGSNKCSAYYKDSGVEYLLNLEF